MPAVFGGALSQGDQVVSIGKPRSLQFDHFPHRRRTDLVMRGACGLPPRPFEKAETGAPSWVLVSV